MSYDPIERTPSAYDFPLLIKQLLVPALARVSPNEIVYAERVRYGYPELNRRIAQLANVLVGAGAAPGKTVAVMDWDSHRYFESYFAIPSLGCVMQTVNVRLSPEQILYTLNHARAEIILVNTDFLPVLESIFDKLETARRFILIDEAGEAPRSRIPFAGEYEQLMAQAPRAYEFPDFDENTRATIFYTSGTTGLPKGVYYSHRQMVLHALGVLATFGTAPTQGRVHSDDVYMPITPMFHAHAWGWPYAATLLGMKQVFPGRYTPELLLRLIVKEKVTFSHCVTTLLHMVLTHPDSAKVDWRGIKMLIGGGALPSGLAAMAMERGIDVFTGYGMSETGPLQILNQLTRDELQADPARQVGMRVRAGRPVLLCDVRTVDENMNFLPRDGKSVGEVVFRSPWVTQGYFKNPEASEQLWRGGWMHSNDLGFFNADGNLQICDRMKDVIKTGGEWVSSLELESLISKHPGVSEVAVIAMADAKWGERPVALVVPKPEQRASIDAESVRAHLRTFADSGAISKYAVPDKVIFVESLEKTSVGKLDKKVLRTKYQGG
ncbi:MAG: fatty acid--CoA ligase [Nevskia sp.]|nr:fatty acid--CoA ligase [Nevskia sp.]